MENDCCSSYYLAYAVCKRAAGRLQLSKCALFLQLVSYWEVVTRILIFCGVFLVGMIFPLMRVESIFFNLFWNVNIFVAAKKNFCRSWIWMTKSDSLLSVNVTVSCNVLSRWAQLVRSSFAGCLFLLSDLQIQIWKNGLQLKLKLHKVRRTALWQHSSLSNDFY